ncbi:MAG: hypothetical protein NTX71_00715 [Candidatus Aureabacteria bacterium]|nr:hypothetical protein [Candidatus Auribacterota bacterium]
MINCAQCNRDISSESFRYEADDGRILCEECFHGEEATPEPHGAKFGFLRVLVQMLKIMGFVGLAGGAVLAHSSYGYNGLISAGAAICGILIFLACLILSELVRLGLSLEQGIERVSLSTDRLLNLIRAQEKGPAVPDGTREGEEPW